MKVIDCITYNGEKDLLNLRHEILKDYVDEFIVVQAPTTFSGNPKPIYEVPEWATSYLIDENYTPEEIELAENSPNTIGADHWKHEFLQKESIKKALTHLDDEDVVFVGDVDEIWEPKAIKMFHPSKLKLRVYTYYLDNRSTEVFWGTLVARYWEIKKECLNEMRSKPLNKTEFELGWHFTSLKDGLRKKLEDSYTADSYATPEVMANLESNIENNRDFLGRPFEYWTDESELPEYVIINRQKYAHLFA